MATGSSLGIDPMQLLASLVGSETNVNQNSSRTETGISSQTANTTGSQTTTGSNQATTATTGQASNQGSTTQQTQNTANTADLVSLMNQQRAGLTPEALKAIFAQGSEGMPQVIGAYSNAVGASAANNSGVQTALEGMMSKILQTAALSQQQGVNSAAETAARIAQLTSGSTTSGTNSNIQSTSQTQNQAGTTSQTATSTQQQQVDGTTGKTTTGSENTQQATNVNDDRVLGLLGLLLGGGVLNSGLTQAGLGGLAGAGGSAMTAAGGGIAELLKMLGVGGTSNRLAGRDLATGGADIGSLLTDMLAGQTMSDQQLGDILGNLPQFSTGATDPLGDFWTFGTTGD
jgi:hypothetical protein